MDVYGTFINLVMKLGRKIRHKDYFPATPILLNSKRFYYNDSLGKKPSGLL
jgi:hypothetical protein